PKIATGDLRLQAFGVTEPNSGSDTTKLQTTAVKKGDRYVVNGQKMFISRVLQSDLMLLLARTTPVDKVTRKTDGLSVFLVDIRGIKGLEVRPLRMMMNHSTNALFFDGMEIPADGLIGQEGKGFSYRLDGMNAERLHRLPRRVRLRRGVRHRAEVPRVPALQDRAHQQQPRARLRRRAHPAHAAVVLRRARPDSPPGAARYRSLNRMPLGREKRSAWNSESS